MRRPLTLVLAVAAGLAAGALGARASSPEPGGADNALDQARIGLSLQPSNALVMIALERGYFADQRLAVTVEKYVSGARAIQDGLFASKIDLATASDVPVVLDSFARRDFRVLATIFKVDDQNRIVGRADRGVWRPRDLKGKRIATQKGSAVQYFLHLFLLEHDISDRQIHPSFLSPGALPKALERGDIDAFSMREPYVGQARALLGENAVVFAAPGLYAQTDQLVIAEAFLRAKPVVAEKALRALVQAEAFAAANPEASREIVARLLGAGSAEIAGIWPELAPSLTLEQSLLLRLEDIARWAVRKQLVKAREVPNFLRLIHADTLEAVKPAAVTIVR